MTQQMKLAEALNLAIWLRDNCDSMSRVKLLEEVERLGEYRIFSSRQICAIVNNNLSHSVIAKKIQKGDKTGGALNPGTLDILRNVLYSRAEDKRDIKLIQDAFGMGTSQSMIARLTGIPQSTISKELKKYGEQL